MNWVLKYFRGRFRGHISVSTTAELKRLKIESAVVPGGCTKFIQPADVSWNGPFKCRLGELYDWLATSQKFYTIGGNVKAPDIETVCQWVIDAWQSVDVQIIQKSFQVCGITNAVDGSEDDLIGCCKHSADLQVGRAILAEPMAKIEHLLDDVEAEGGLHCATDIDSPCLAIVLSSFRAWGAYDR